MIYTANSHCCTCTKSLHLSGDQTYVSLGSSRFSNLHEGHQTISLRPEDRWRGLDNGTDWATDQSSWKTTFDSFEYQDYLRRNREFWSEVLQVKLTSPEDEFKLILEAEEK